MSRYLSSSGSKSANSSDLAGAGFFCGFPCAGAVPTVAATARSATTAPIVHQLRIWDFIARPPADGSFNLGSIVRRTGRCVQSAFYGRYIQDETAAAMALAVEPSTEMIRCTEAQAVLSAGNGPARKRGGKLRCGARAGEIKTTDTGRNGCLL